MYKALELYPKNIDGMREHLFVTHAVDERIRSAKKKCRADKDFMSYIANVLEVNIPYMESFVSGNRFPYLSAYLVMAEKLGWDLSRDVNYAYAVVKYPPEEIRRRLMRVFPFSRTLNSACFLMECEIGYDIEQVRSTVMYGKHRSCSCYGRLMNYLRKREQEAGYQDALSFED